MSLLATNATAATRSTVNAVTSSVVLLAVNRDRKGYALWNAGTGTLFVAHGATAGSTSDYTYQLASGSYYESSVDYTGPVSGTWSGSGGTANVTEYS